MLPRRGGFFPPFTATPASEGGRTDAAPLSAPAPPSARAGSACTHGPGSRACATPAPALTRRLGAPTPPSLPTVSHLPECCCRMDAKNTYISAQRPKAGRAGQEAQRAPHPGGGSEPCALCTDASQRARVLGQTEPLGPREAGSSPISTAAYSRNADAGDFLIVCVECTKADVTLPWGCGRVTQSKAGLARAPAGHTCTALAEGSAQKLSYVSDRGWHDARLWRGRPHETECKGRAAQQQVHTRDLAALVSEPETGAPTRRLLRPRRGCLAREGTIWASREASNESTSPW